MICHAGYVLHRLVVAEGESPSVCEQESSFIPVDAVCAPFSYLYLLKSAISDDCKPENHIMDWKNSTIIASESHRDKQWIKEAIEIRKQGADTINKDGGAFLLATR